MHNFSARLWEQLVHFHVMRLTDSLFLWVGATPHLRNLAVAMCSRYVSAGGLGRPGGGERGARGTVGAAPGRPDPRRERGWAGGTARGLAPVGASGRAPGSRRGDRGLGPSRPAGGVTLGSPALVGPWERSRALPVMSGGGVGPHRPLRGTPAPAGPSTPRAPSLLRPGSWSVRGLRRESSAPGHGAPWGVDLSFHALLVLAAPTFKCF